LRPCCCPSLLYPLLLSQRNRLKLVARSGAAGAAPAADRRDASRHEHFLEADGGSIRAKAFALAIEHIGQHPLLGAGEDSAYGDSYQDIVAKYFFPSDLGLVGVTYKYGFTGVLLYLFMHGKIWLRLWQANLAARPRQDGRIRPAALGIAHVHDRADLQPGAEPGLAYAQGITARFPGPGPGSLRAAMQSRAQPGLRLRRRDRSHTPPPQFARERGRLTRRSSQWQTSSC
jgi:hypothetical protein